MLPELAEKFGTDPGPARKVRGPDFRERSLLAGKSRMAFWGGVSASVAAHVLMFGGALVYAHWAAPRIVPDKPITAKLVRLGKPRDEKLLPRLPAAPPPPPAAASAPPPAVPTPAEPAKAAVPVPNAPPQPTKSAALERQQKMLEALGKLGPAPTGPTGKVAEELPGQTDGDARGTVEDAEASDRYLALVDAALRDGYALPETIPVKERLFLSCLLFLEIARDGTIKRFRIDESSGNPHFDRAIEAKVKATKLPPPPPAFFAAYPDGLPIRFKP